MLTSLEGSTLTPFHQATFAHLGYDPSSEQAICHACGKRYILITGGYQSGKSYWAIKEAVARIMADMAEKQPCPNPAECKGHADGGQCKITLIYWLIGNDYIQTEQEFEYLKVDLRELGFDDKAAGFHIDDTKGCDPGYIDIYLGQSEKPFIHIETKTARFPERIARVSPDGIILCEAGQMPFSIYRIARGRTIGARAWMLLIGTIEDSQPWYPAMAIAWQAIYPDRKSLALPTWSNKHLFPGGRLDPEILSLEAEQDDDWFMTRIEGRPSPPKGLVFSFNPDIHINDELCVYTPGQTIYIWTDPGFQRGKSAHACMIAQIINGQVRLIDEFHEYEKTVNEVAAWCQQQIWWGRENKVLAIDPYYKDNHNALASVAEVWRQETGLTTSKRNKRVSINAGDNLLARFLKAAPVPGSPELRPGLICHSRCTGFISEMGVIPSPHSKTGEVLAYRWPLDKDGNHAASHPTSMHCDAIRAVEAGLVAHYGIATSARRTVTPTYR